MGKCSSNTASAYSTSHKKFWLEMLGKKEAGESDGVFLRRKEMERETQQQQTEKTKLNEKEKDPGFKCHCPVCKKPYSSFNSLG